jgi:putative copper resistance protein D
VTPVVSGLVHGLGLLALAAIIGGLVLERMILPAGLPELVLARARLRRWITGCLVVLIPLTIVELVVRTQVMSRAPLAVAVASLPEVVSRTHLGAVLTARVGALLLAGLLSLTTATALRALCLLIALGVALTLSLTGHAADWGDVTPSVAVDWVHAAAAAAWTGGLLGLALAVLPGQAALPPPVLGAVGRRFSRLAGFCLLTVVATGISNAWSQLGVVSRLWTTAYGRVLLVKVAVVVALVCLGAVNRYVVVPRLSDDRARAGFGARLFRVSRLVIRGPRRGARGAAAPARLSTYVTLEALIALAVFACTAALGEVTPGRHTAFERKPASHVTNITPSPSGGGTRVSGTVTPPPGDAARGRSVFVKLQCFTCHAVRGEQVPAPSRPGPDLTEVGRYHPGYLVESIMNPNARIVDGPGYTDARGLSTMPDYREKLTVSELIDLVTYLKGLGGGADPARK